MNKFRELGYIAYNGHLEVHSSLLDAVLRGLAPTMTQARKNALEAATHRPPAEYLAEDALLPFEAE
jgi:hypothetical protein